MTEIQSQADLRKMIRERLVHHPGGCERGQTAEWGRRVTENLSRVTCSHCRHVIAKYGIRVYAPVAPDAPVAVLHPGDRFTCPGCGWRDYLPAYQREGEILDPDCGCNWPYGVRIDLERPW
jgi:hypothetical protein